MVREQGGFYRLRHSKDTARGRMRTIKVQDLDTGVTTVRLAGDLTDTTETKMRSAIGTAAAESPPAVLVDLSDLSRADSVQLNVLAAATHQAQQAFGVP